jgi:hypothetical protein
MPQQPRYGFQCEWFHPFSAAASWGGAVIRGYGATAVRLTPDQKVGSSNLSGLTFSSQGHFNIGQRNNLLGLTFMLKGHQHFRRPGRTPWSEPGICPFQSAWREHLIIVAANAWATIWIKSLCQTFGWSECVSGPACSSNQPAIAKYANCISRE